MCLAERPLAPQADAVLWAPWEAPQPDPGGSMGWHGHHTLNSCSHMISGIAAPFTEASWRPSSMLTKVTRIFYIYVWLSRWISTSCFHVMCHPSDSITKEATKPFARVIPPCWGTLAGSSNQARAAGREHGYYSCVSPPGIYPLGCIGRGPFDACLERHNCLVHAAALQNGWVRNTVFVYVSAQHILRCPCRRSSPLWQHWL